MPSPLRAHVSLDLQRWMECPNRGSPFDRDVELAVLARLDKIDREVA
jgi:hypothetical protein